jgi:hypothetical protein
MASKYRVYRSLLLLSYFQGSLASFRCTACLVQAEMISAKEAGEKWHGLMRTDDLKGALWLPGTAWR